MARDSAVITSCSKVNYLEALEATTMKERAFGLEEVGCVNNNS